MADPTHTPRRASKETYELEEFEQQAGPSNYKKKEKPMRKCPFCAKSFKDLKRHVKVCTVNINHPVDLLQRIIACPLCPKLINTIFESLGSLKQHCKQVHKQELDPEWGPRTLADLDYEWCIMCRRYTRDKEEHQILDCYPCFQMNYTHHMCMFNPLFEREETHADYSAYRFESSDDDEDFEDAENKRYKFEFKHQIRRRENKERLAKLKEYQEMGKKSWMEQKKKEKLERAKAREETAVQGRGKKGKGKYARNFSYNVFARETKKNIDKTRPTCKRVRDNDSQDNEVKSKSVKTQTELKSKSVKTQANMTSEEEDASVPIDQKKITEYFTVLGSKTREKQVAIKRVSTSNAEPESDGEISMMVDNILRDSLDEPREDEAMDE